MENKYIVEIKEKNNIIEDLKKQLEICLSKNKKLNNEIETNEIFYELHNDLLSEDNLNIKAYFKIKEMKLFDYDYYISNYNYNSKIDPLLHYIYKGYKENKNPNSKFDGEFYSNRYPEIKEQDINPLVYFVLKGQNEGKTLVNKYLQNRNTINKTELTPKINKFNITGINENSLYPRVIVSLTSFPQRIYDLHYCIFSLLNQKFKPDKVVLWLAEEEFPNKENDLTTNLLTLKNNGLEIKWCKNIYSYKKLLPSLKEYPNDIIVTADDDIFYPNNWLSSLYEMHTKFPESIIAHRTRKISLNEDNSFKQYSEWELIENYENPSYLNFFTGAGGVLYPPKSLDEKIFDENTFMKICPSTDDIWIWAMAILNKTKIKPVDDGISELTYINLAREDLVLNEKVLWSVNTRGDNDVQLKNLLECFPEITENIFEE